MKCYIYVYESVKFIHTAAHSQFITTSSVHDINECNVELTVHYFNR
jgi:hypothetical protein